ncbi:MAG: CRTAC1 family protein [Planctomycetota bacterium]
MKSSQQFTPARKRSAGGAPWILLAVVVLAIVGLAGYYLLMPVPGTQTDDSTVDESGPAWFAEGAAAAGIDFVHASGFDGKTYLFPEIFCAGVGVFDYDNDGLLDIYLVQSAQLEGGQLNQPGQSNRLYRNLGARKFQDVTEQAGVGDAGYGIGCACGDYDNDGDVDLYVTNVGADVLYRNDGNGQFTDVSRTAGISQSARVSASAAFGDYDNDGDLDLYVVHYVDWSKSVELPCYNSQGTLDYCQPLNYRLPGKDVLYRNDGNGQFTDVSKEVGIHSVFGNGFGIAAGDLNDDGRLDYFVANDSDPNQLWLQNDQGKFAESSLWHGVAVNQMGDAEAGMGAAAIDIDHDGDLDLYLTHLITETNTLYLNAGGGDFEDRTDQLGFGATSFSYTGWGLGFGDFDNDTHLDAYIANGGVMIPDNAPQPDPYVQHNVLLTSDNSNKFRAVSPKGGTRPPLLHTSRGAAFGDLDNDGGIDVVVNNKDASPYLLWNVRGSERQWIRFRVLEQGRDAHYARVKIEGGFGTRRRMVDRSYSYASSSEATLHFGLGTETAVSVAEVRWLDGSTESFGPFSAGQTHVLERGKGR